MLVTAFMSFPSIFISLLFDSLVFCRVYQNVGGKYDGLKGTRQEMAEYNSEHYCMHSRAFRPLCIFISFVPFSRVCRSCLEKKMALKIITQNGLREMTQFHFSITDTHTREHTHTFKDVLLP